MKKKQINDLVNHKISLVVSSIFICLVLLITIGTSYSFKESELDLNNNGSVEVGDVVKLRKYIIEDLTKHTVELDVTGATILNKNTDIVVEATDIKFYVVPNKNYYLKSLTCTNNQTATYNNYVVTLSNVTKDTTCTATFEDNTDNSGANDPKLAANMIPVVYDNSTDTWVKVAIYSAGDFNQDGLVDSSDQSLLTGSCYNTTVTDNCKKYDLNQDGNINIDDLGLLTSTLCTN